MSCNPLLIPTLLLAFVFFRMGVWLWRRSGPAARWLLLPCVVVLSLPGILLAGYYLHFLDRAGWFFAFRSLPGTELTASGTGWLAGCLQGMLTGSRWQRVIGATVLASLLAFGIFLPYAKPILSPAPWHQYSDRWSDGICMQSTGSSCGPACAATILKRSGRNATELEIARDACTSATGTENWYLARVLRKRSLSVRYVVTEANPPEFPYPSIAGVSLGGPGGAGHFITILDRTPDGYVFGDPLAGRLSLSREKMMKRYFFTGFFMRVGVP
jgi:hypothetical protein